MQLTKAQRRNLELYAQYHATPPTFWQIFRMNLTRYLILAVLIFLVYILARTAGTEALAMIAIGLFLGVLLRDISRFRQFVYMWPATSAVIDWDRLEVLLKGDDTDSLENVEN